MSSLKTKFHRDGTITYWSVYRQVWEQHAAFIFDRDLAAISEPERSRIRKHLIMLDCGRK